MESTEVLLADTWSIGEKICRYISVDNIRGLYQGQKMKVKVSLQWRRKKFQLMDSKHTHPDPQDLPIILAIITGPDLPIAIKGHSMVTLGFGQAILGGESNNDAYQSKIYFLTCSKQICMLSTLNKELSVPRSSFVAIPIPDSMSGCIGKSKFEYFLRIFSRLIQSP